MQSLGEAPALPNNKSYHLATPSGLKRYSDQCRWCLNPRPQLQNNTTTKQHQTEGKGLGPPSKAPEPIRAERRRSDDDRRRGTAPRCRRRPRGRRRARRRYRPTSSISLLLLLLLQAPQQQRAAAATEQQQQVGRMMPPPPPSCHSPDHKQRGDPEETPDPPVTHPGRASLPGL